MLPFLEAVPLILKSFFLAFVNLQFLLLFLVVMALIALQYGRMERIREDFFGVKTGLARADILSATGFGLLGGLAGSFLAVFTGLTVSGELYYLWAVAVLLMLINMRFLCFAYAGGVLAFSHLLLGFPAINVPQILALVAVLHMVESFLILVSGHLGAVPAYIKGAGGKVVGGFTLQKFWPIPIIVLAVITGVTVEGGVEMPDWWPLIRPGIPGDPRNLTYLLLPVVAGLGYGDVAIARSPAEKSRLSSLCLGAYSLLLLVLAVLADQSRAVAVAAALFSPLGHEAVIFAGRALELKGKPLYVPPEKGVRVLDVIPDSPAWRLGLRPGDVVLAFDGQELSGSADFYSRLKEAFLPLTVDYRSQATGTPRRGVMLPPAPGRPWGIVTVPEAEEDRYVELFTTGPLGRWLLQGLRKFMS
ncbi:hypothetical serine protease [Pelotomaculum thermopropionicum SI]|uniref:Hypothetical serine protease n=1 Tax=Pelotomaculum thermopropionicum (strain DSM 13744 / JCM 10971 / SI) TaxID=370438 RepID=A5CYM1_PELTS|nr:hypothetical serine protease [Pelotomaculum thermopropionicum SI]